MFDELPSTELIVGAKNNVEDKISSRFNLSIFVTDLNISEKIANNDHLYSCQFDYVFLYVYKQDVYHKHSLLASFCLHTTSYLITR